jgi:DNA-binding winged helix-turn-helix (wHTH) protein
MAEAVMSNSITTPETLAFLDFELIPVQRLLLRHGQPVRIGGRAFDLLTLLASHPGQVLDTDLLMYGVWPGMVVEDINLRVQMAALRKLLGDAHCHHIATMAGRGYCFMPAVQRLAAAPSPY